MHRLLALDTPTHVEPEPDRSLSSHRAAVNSLVVSRSLNPETGLCVSASKDKTAIIWNYHTGALLRTLLFSASPLCLALDPASQSVYAACDDSAIYVVELFGPKALLGGRSDELASTTVQIKNPLGVADSDAGPATCLSVSFDGNILLSGHLKGTVLRWSINGNGGHAAEIANLNFAVSNVQFVPVLHHKKPTIAHSIVKPLQTNKLYTFTSQLEGEIAEDDLAARPLDEMFKIQGFSAEALESATAALIQPRTTGVKAVDADIEQERDQLWALVKELQDLQKVTYQKFVQASKSSR